MSVEKITKILNCFTYENPSLRNKDIADMLNMHPSSVHHIVSSLCKEGILIQDSRKMYRLGWKLLEWSNNVMHHQDINNALPLIDTLTRKYKCVVHIGMYDEGSVRFLLRVASEDSIDIPTHLGGGKPAYATSAGKVLLAFNSAFVQPTIAKGLVQEGKNTITSTYDLKEELTAIKKNGYALSDNENNDQAYAIAAPITSYSGRTVAALNMIGTITYMKSINRKEAIQDVIKTANLISKEVGYIENL